MNVSVVAGGAGFIGCNLLRVLAQEDRKIFILDNLCRGREQYIDSFRKIAGDRVQFIRVDLAEPYQTMNAFELADKAGAIDEVWHLAANSDIPAGVMNAQVDLRDTFMTTVNLLEAMKVSRVGKMHFASSSAIYGDLGGALLHESIGPLLPISNYGAMKLASEASISAATESFLERANLFRFPNVVGIPATHGVILDFINKLKRDPGQLHVLGNGTQQKSYLHVSDLVDAMMHIRGLDGVSKVYPINIGAVDDGVTVRYIAEEVIRRISPDADISFGIGNKGWVGDVPKFRYSVERLEKTGWSPNLSSAGAVLYAIEQIANQEGFVNAAESSNE